MLHPELERRIAEAERSKQVILSTLNIGETLVVQTVNTRYTVKKVNDEGEFLIKGNPKYCPTDTLCRIPGCTWGGSLLKYGSLIEGCYMEFVPTAGEYKGDAILTSRIVVLERMN
jgi:hypothetical protein